MEHLTEEHLALLLCKEWLVKIDSQTSTPYLIKFYSSPQRGASCCCVLVTDMKTTWAEVLTAKEFARRWRNCNGMEGPPLADIETEDTWRKHALDVLSKAHTIGGIKDLDFEVSESHYADLACVLHCAAFKWRWELAFVGYKQSAEILSKHLIMPLVSVNHLAFSSVDPISEMPGSELEKAVDKMARTARRTVDTHIKHAISKPRVASTIQRVTAMFSFASDLPAIISTAETPEFQELVQPLRSSEQFSPKSPSILPSPKHPTRPDLAAEVTGQDASRQPQDDSATEPDSDDSVPDKSKGKSPAGRRPQPDPDVQPNNLSPPPAPQSLSQNRNTDSDSQPSPPRPAKKPKVQNSSSDDDSDTERKKHVAMLKGGSDITKRGAKQPLRRGGKRF